MVRTRALLLLALLGLFTWQASEGFAIAPPARGHCLAGARCHRLQRRAESSSPGKVEEGFYFLSYFFFQNGMAVLMKQVLSKAQVAKDLFGVPASFLVMASQQVVSFSLISLVVAYCWLLKKDSPIQKKPNDLKGKDVMLLLIGSCAFSLNIGFNLLALSLLPLSLSLIIRSCSPITTSAMQTFFRDKSSSSDVISLPEWACLCVGVVCAAMVTVASSGIGVAGAVRSTGFWWGVSFSVGSLFMGAADFVIKSKLGKGPNFTAWETTYYNALPVALITFTIGSFLPTPVPASWAARFGSPLTDLTVFSKVLQVGPGAFRWVLASGVATCAFNLLVTDLVMKLSPATGAFAGNFNKSASILVSLFLIERSFPHDLRGWVKVGAVVGNITAFYLYNQLKKKRRQKK